MNHNRQVASSTLAVGSIPSTGRYTGGPGFDLVGLTKKVGCPGAPSFAYLRRAGIMELDVIGFDQAGNRRLQELLIKCG